MMMKTNACGSCGKPKGFSSRRPREADFLWEEGRDPWQTAQFAVSHGRDPAFHGKCAPEHDPQEGGSES